MRDDLLVGELCTLRSNPNFIYQFRECGEEGTILIYPLFCFVRGNWKYGLWDMLDAEPLSDAQKPPSGYYVSERDPDPFSPMETLKLLDRFPGERRHFNILALLARLG